MNKKKARIIEDHRQQRVSDYSVIQEVSDEYIRYDKDLELEKEEVRGSIRGSIDSDVIAINDRKQSGDFWRNYFKEQHVITGGRSESEQKRKRRVNGKNKDAPGVIDWEGWWLRSSGWRRLEWTLVILIFFFAIAQFISTIYLVVKMLDD